MALVSRSQLRWTLFLVALWVGGCASPSVTQQADSVEALLHAPMDQVRAAVLDVFASEGYTVESLQDRFARTESIQTDYREEIRAPWDWMLRVRFGVGRTQAAANLNEEGERSTKLLLTVHHESKGSLAGSWTPSEPPLRHGAEHYLRLIKNELRLL